jgi:hypothetical protein
VIDCLGNSVEAIVMTDKTKPVSMRLAKSEIEQHGGVYCNEESIHQRDGKGIKKESDEFAATLLMPFHDFRRLLPANERPDFQRLSALAKRYGVSLTAAILRWLEYTETLAMMVVSNEGYALWARSSDSALNPDGLFAQKKRCSSSLLRRLRKGGFSPKKQRPGSCSRPRPGDFLKGSLRCAFGPNGTTKKSPSSISKGVHQSSFGKKRIWKILTIAS